jgi:hypothetical protein
MSLSYNTDPVGVPLACFNSKGHYFPEFGAGELEGLVLS